MGGGGGGGSVRVRGRRRRSRRGRWWLSRWGVVVGGVEGDDGDRP